LSESIAIDADRLSTSWRDTLEEACLKIVAAGHEPEKCMQAYGPSSSVTIWVNISEPSVGEKLVGTDVYRQWVRMTTVDGRLQAEVMCEWLVEVDADGQPVIPGPA
jgi:hypothetical protein